MFKSLVYLPLVCVLASCSTHKNNTYSTQNKPLIQDLQTLSAPAFEGRRTGTEGSLKARNYIIDRYKKLGLISFATDSPYVQKFQVQSRNRSVLEGRNILGYIPGKTEKAIVISAHYDHLGLNNNNMYLGADDNASGAAALLEIAKYFSKNKPNYTLVFAAFDAEEMGLQGAKAFVANTPKPIAIENILLNINMDMISRSDKNELYAAGTFKNPQLKKYFDNLDTPIKLLLGHDDPKLGRDDWTNQSDQGAFNAKNIPFIYFGVEDHKDYHKPSDIFENIQQKFYIQSVATILALIKRIDHDAFNVQPALKEKMIMH